MKAPSGTPSRSVRAPSRRRKIRFQPTCGTFSGPESSRGWARYTTRPSTSPSPAWRPNSRLSVISSWNPRQIPNSGFPAEATRRRASTMPDTRSAAMASANARTRGRRAASAASTSRDEDVIWASRPARAHACRTLYRLPMPKSIIATLGTIGGACFDRATRDPTLQQIALDRGECRVLDSREASPVPCMRGVDALRICVVPARVPHDVVVEDRGEAHRLGSAVCRRLVYVIERPRAAARDHRNRNGLRNAAREVHIQSLPGSFTIDRRDEQLAGAQLRGSHRPFDRIDAGTLAPAVRVGLVRAVGPANRFDRDDDRRRPEPARGFANELRLPYRGRIQRYLVGPRSQHRTNVLDGSQATAHGQRNEYLPRGPFDHVEEIIATVQAGDDIHVEQLVGARLVVVLGESLGLSEDPQALEVDSLDEVRPLDI